MVDKLLKNLLSPQKVSRSIAMLFLDKIATHSKVKITHLLQSVPYIDTNPRIPQSQEPPPVIFWATYLQSQEIEKRVPEVIKMYKGGFS